MEALDQNDTIPDLSTAIIQFGLTVISLRQRTRDKLLDIILTDAFASARKKLIEALGKERADEAMSQFFVENKELFLNK